VIVCVVPSTSIVPVREPPPTGQFSCNATGRGVDQSMLVFQSWCPGSPTVATRIRSDEIETCTPPCGDGTLKSVKAVPIHRFSPAPSAAAGTSPPNQNSQNTSSPTVDAVVKACSVYSRRWSLSNSSTVGWFGMNRSRSTSRSADPNTPVPNVGFGCFIGSAGSTPICTPPTSGATLDRIPAANTHRRRRSGHVEENPSRGSSRVTARSAESIRNSLVPPMLYGGMLMSPRVEGIARNRAALSTQSNSTVPSALQL
jgi:hypothetical protein